MMKLLFFYAKCALVACCLFLVNVDLIAGETVEIKNVKLRLIESQKFYRISEFFTGIENTGKREIIRSDPKFRGGLYYILNLSCSIQDLPEGTSYLIHYYAAEANKVLSEEFHPTDLKKKNVHTVFLGITHSDEHNSSLPIAWKVQLLNKDRSVLVEKKSYLWEMPDSTK